VILHTKKQFFNFFESIIHHHLPDVEVQIDPSFEPRIQSLQPHVCRAVCHKYGNDGKCQFLFPHEIVEASYFDPETNSVTLVCRDATVNYFNPYILIFCRHNH
jgi:uncharacterized protein (DUF927 family)